MKMVRSRIFAFSAGLLLACDALFAETPAEPAHRPVVPLTPAELIKFLPAVPPEWQVTSSTASNVFSDWLMTVAERKYKAVPASQQPSGGGAPPLPMLLAIRVSDTGGWKGFAVEFQQAGGANGLRINGMPAVKFSTSERRETLRFLINDRFIVQISTENQTKNATEDWAKRLDLSRLSQIEPSGSTEIPRPVVISRVDELNPKKNRSYPLHWMSAEETDAEARRDAAR